MLMNKWGKWGMLLLFIISNIIIFGKIIPLILNAVM